MTQTEISIENVKAFQRPRAYTYFLLWNWYCNGIINGIIVENFRNMHTYKLYIDYFAEIEWGNPFFLVILNEHESLSVMMNANAAAGTMSFSRRVLSVCMYVCMHVCMYVYVCLSFIFSSTCIVDDDVLNNFYSRSIIIFIFNQANAAATMAITIIDQKLKTCLIFWIVNQYFQVHQFIQFEGGWRKSECDRERREERERE